MVLEPTKKLTELPHQKQHSPLHAGCSPPRHIAQGMQTRMLLTLPQEWKQQSIFCGHCAQQGGEETPSPESSSFFFLFFFQKILQVMVKLCTTTRKKPHGDNPTTHLQAPVYAQGEQANIQNLGITVFPTGLVHRQQAQIQSLSCSPKHSDPGVRSCL